MKNTMVIVLLAFAATLTTVAQERKPRQEQRAEEIASQRTEHMAEALGLSEDQKEQVYALNLERAERMIASRQERQARMAEMQAERKITLQRLDEILTAEQRDLLRKQLAERKDRMKIMRNSDRAHRPDGKRNRRQTDETGVHKQSGDKNAAGTPQEE